MAIEVFTLNRRYLGGFYETTHRKVKCFSIAILGDVVSPPVSIAHEEDNILEAANILFIRGGGVACSR